MRNLPQFSRFLQVAALSNGQLLNFSKMASDTGISASTIRDREARNQTSHAYDERKAQLVYQILPDFIENVRFLILQLESRLGLAS